MHDRNFVEVSLLQYCICNDQLCNDDNTTNRMLIKVDDNINDAMMTITMMTETYILDCLKAFER